MALTLTITLYVNTQSIDEKNIDEKCNFKQPKGVTNEEYTVALAVGDTVIWEGVSLDSKEDLVTITNIDCTGGSNIFGGKGIKGNGEGQFVGVVENDTNGEGETYSLYFEVFNGVKSRGIYSIDPKLQVNL